MLISRTLMTLESAALNSPLKILFKNRENNPKLAAYFSSKKKNTQN